MSTRVHIPKPVAAERLFLHLLGILESHPRFTPSWEQPEGTPFRTEPGPLRLDRATYKHVRKGDPSWVTEQGVQRYEFESALRSTLGQGLAALLDVSYGSDAPLSWPHGDGEECDCTDYGNTADPLHEHMVSVDFDTGYGWRAPNGAGCADLHAYLLTEVATWLASEGVEDWSWHHEERGTWHGPHEIHLRGVAILAALDFAHREKE